jgi:hypothetical protein
LWGFTDYGSHVESNEMLLEFCLIFTTKTSKIKTLALANGNSLEVT